MQKFKVKLNDNTPVFFGMAMKPNNMVGYVPTASIGMEVKERINNGAHGRIMFMEEGRGGYASGNDIYVTGNVQHRDC